MRGMGRRFISLTVIFLLLPPAGWGNPPKMPAFPPLVFHPPKPERIVLPNGLVLFLLEDHELPLVRLEMMVRAGEQYDSPDLLGMSQVFGPALTEGGSEHHAPDEIQRALDSAGASMNFSVGMESAGGTMECRKEDFDKIFGLFTDLLRHPLFRDDFVELQKDKELEGLRRMNDDPEEVGRREFRRAIYGRMHPYSRIPNPATIDQIHRKDLLAMHAKYFHPNAMWLALSGDFKSAEMKQKITAALGDWPSVPVTYPVVPPVTPTAQSAVYYIQLPINQSQIRIGHTGLARHNPDHFAWEVFNELWGNGGASRLFRVVRTQKGLAYAVGSTFSEPADLGLIVAICQTRSPQTTAAVQSINDITKSLINAPFTDEEIHSAKESIRNRFIENYNSSAGIVSEEMSLEYRGYPRNYLDTYTEHIAEIQRSDLQRVARSYLHPEKNVILVVGDLSTFDQPLSVLGTPQEIKIPDYREEDTNEYTPTRPR